jgi:hypothetical protein
MHPLILQQLAADRVAEMIARADGRRQERQARGARPARTSRRRAWPSPLRTQADPPAQRSLPSWPRQAQPSRWRREEPQIADLANGRGW